MQFIACRTFILYCFYHFNSIPYASKSIMDTVAERLVMPAMVHIKIELQNKMLILWCVICNAPELFYRIKISRRRYDTVTIKKAFWHKHLSCFSRFLNNLIHLKGCSLSKKDLWTFKKRFNWKFFLWLNYKN